MLNRLSELEAKQRGSPDFPLEYHLVDRLHPRYEMPYHWHNEFELIQVRSGTFTLTIDSTQHILLPGDVAFIDPGALHSGEPRDCMYECIVFDLRLLLRSNDHCKRMVSDVVNQKVQVNHIFPRGHRVIRYTIPPMFDALREQCEGYTMITLGCLFQFLGEVYKHGTYTTSDDDKQSRRMDKLLMLKQVFEKIENEYANNLTLADLAGSVHMTTKHFCRFFKEATYRTPMDYLSYFRIDKASYELVTSDKSVTEVALESGFSSLNYFIRAFKKYKGVTPGTYVKQMRT